MRRKTYTANQVINGLVFIREIAPRKHGTRLTFRRAIFECSCGKQFPCLTASVNSGHTRSCGCASPPRHGLYHHPLYRTWANIKNRCYDQNNPDYHYYGGRGIVMDDDFKLGFVAFLNYISTLPNYADKDRLFLTLDRINNDKGYERGNLRWATMSDQCSNRRSRFRHLYESKTSLQAL